MAKAQCNVYTLGLVYQNGQTDVYTGDFYNLISAVISTLHEADGPLETIVEIQVLSKEFTTDEPIRWKRG